MADDTAYDAASFSSAKMASWTVKGGSADADLLPELDTIRDRQRDLDRNNGLAKGAIQTKKDNIIGSMLRLSAKPDYRVLGRMPNGRATGRGSERPNFGPGQKQPNVTPRARSTYSASSLRLLVGSTSMANR